MAKNNRLKKKAQPVTKAEPSSDRTQVIQGNIPVLTVQLLSSINQNLITLTTIIKEELVRQNKRI
jgi:hypothetical protein